MDYIFPSKFRPVYDKMETNNSNNTLLSSSECCKLPESMKFQKKHLKDLYQCLCFKKRPKYIPNPSKIYATPSNSKTCICETVTNDAKACANSCGVQENDAKRNNLIKRIDIEKKVSKRKSNYRCLDQSFVNVCREVSDSDSCRCGYDQCR